MQSHEGESGAVLEGEARDGLSDEGIFGEGLAHNEGLSCMDVWGRHSRQREERRRWNSESLNGMPRITCLFSWDLL